MANHPYYYSVQHVLPSGRKVTQMNCTLDVVTRLLGEGNVISVEREPITIAQVERAISSYYKGGHIDG